MTPSDAIQAFLKANGARKTVICDLSGVTRQKFYSFLEPAKYPRQRLGDADFGAVAVLVTLKTGMRFTADDVRRDYVNRGGVIAVRRGAA